MTGTTISEVKRFDSLSNDQRNQVRVWISGRAKTLLSHFWRPDDPLEVEEEIRRDWVECLKDFGTEEINAACHAYLARPERTEAGRPIRPGPWAIVAIINRQRAHDQVIRRKAFAVARPDRETRQTISYARAKEILIDVEAKLTQVSRSTGEGD